MDKVDNDQAILDEIKRLVPHGYAPGGYLVWCATCAAEFQGDKRAVACKPCAELGYRRARLAAYRVASTSMIDKYIADQIGRHLRDGVTKGGVVQASLDMMQDTLALAEKYSDVVSVPARMQASIEKMHVSCMKALGRNG